MDEARLVLVTGGRDFADRDAVFKALDTVLRKYPNTTVLHGACPTGADAHAQAWAVDRERPFVGVPAEWGRRGDSAGPIRNSLLIGYLPDACIAFAGGAGTSDMVRKARAAEIPVWLP
jgi:SLOG family YspA-like protein